MQLKFTFIVSFFLLRNQNPAKSLFLLPLSLSPPHPPTHPDADWKLLLIRHASSVGEIPRGGKIYCIEQIAVLPLTTDPSVEHVGLEVSLILQQRSLATLAVLLLMKTLENDWYGS